jgi:hypothetical protein
MRGLDRDLAIARRKSTREEAETLNRPLAAGSGSSAR